ncbi:MAG: hypothetical protein Q9168_003621 [Polycauliona sp. 1 TL-2023]
MWSESDSIMPDGFQNAQAVLQAGGRTLRMGQKNQSTYYVLTTNHSYDQYIAANATNRILPVISGQADLYAPDDTLRPNNSAAYRQPIPEKLRNRSVSIGTPL